MSLNLTKEFRAMLTPLQILVRDAALYKQLTALQEVTLSKRIQKGSRFAVNVLVKHNLRLAMHLAKASNANASGIYPIEDLISEGMVGLMRAASKYDHSKGRFSTYATFWVKQSITRFVMGNDPTQVGRVPVYMFQIRQKARRKVREAEHATGHMLPEAELCNYEGGKWYQGLACANRKMKSIETSEKALEIPWVDPELERIDASDFLAGAFKSLRSREAAILRLYFDFEPLDRNKPASLKNIGEQFGVTKERIRQIIENSLEKLRVYALESRCLSPDVARAM
jgi:RNA polymerase primary sigma factor